MAHRRAGKTVACINELIKGALTCNRPMPRFAYIAPLYKQAKDVAWSYLKEFGLAYPGAEPNESELRIDFPNGARVRLYGADNPDALRGIYLDGCILDEAGDMKPKLWTEVIRPALSDRKGWAVFIGTPKGRNDFWCIWDESTRDPEWLALMLKASETGLVDEAELAANRRAMTEDQYAQEFECSFDAAIQGAVYGKWMGQADDEGRITTVKPAPGVPVNTAWDLGYDDATAIWFWQNMPGEIRLIDYYEANGEDTAHYCGVIKAKGYLPGKHYVPHDAANELMAAGGRSIVAQAWDAGIKMSVVPATGQQNGIEATRLTLGRCWFDRVKCAQGIEALRQYQFQWDDDKKVFRSKPKHDWASHGADAFEIIGQVWRQQSESAKPPEPKFLHNMTANELFWPKSPDVKRRERI